MCPRCAPGQRLTYRLGGFVCTCAEQSTLAKLYAADIWIILEDVQFTRRDYQHRCYLTPVPDAHLPGRWLTLPVPCPAAGKP